MADINRVILVGRLTRDAELRYTNTGTSICRFSLAVNRRRKSGDEWQDEASFFDIVLFGRQGEAINQYLQKGKQVGIDGELRQSRWEQDGQTRSKVEVVAFNVMLLGGRGSGGSGSGGGDAGSYASRPSGGDQAHDRGGFEDSGPGGGDDFDDDIPF